MPSLPLRYSIIVALASCTPWLGLPASADETAAIKDAFKPEAFGQPVVTRHTGIFNGRTTDYSATVAATQTHNDKGQPSLSIVSFAYERAGKPDANRPVIFAFNGGPIMPSTALHMGLLGPKHVDFPVATKEDPTTFRLVDNPNFPIDYADIVLIDPAGTGFSRPAGSTDLNTYFTVEKDAREFADFIETWLHDHGRDGAPVYILGESYGTIRLPQLAKDLAEDPKPANIAGLVMIGQAANIVEYVQRPANIISYVVSIPTEAATAWYYQAADRQGLSFEDFVGKARDWANSTYLQALYDGDDVSPERAGAIAQSLSDFTGVPKAYFLSHRLRISKEAYRRALFADKKLILGMTDTRYIGPIDKGDPSGVINDAYNLAAQTYLKTDLKVDRPIAYLTDSPNDSWNYGGEASPFLDWPFYKSINDALLKQPHIKIMVATGYYDTQTSTGAAEYLVRQAGWPKANVHLTYYQAGHMAYTDADSATKLANDLRAFVAAPQP